MEAKATLATIDWEAASAVVQAVAAVAIAGLTIAYVNATAKIRDANNRMADANDALINEMRADRQHFHVQRSVDAAHRLTIALISAVRDWTAARDDASYTGMGQLRGRPGQPEPGRSADENRRQAYRDWWLAYMADRGAIHPPALLTDLSRMTDVFGDATHGWDTIIALAEGDDGDPSHPPPTRPDYRAARIRWCERRLLDSLEAHRHGEPVEHCVLPRDEAAFLSLPPGAGEDEFLALVEDE